MNSIAVVGAAITELVYLPITAAITSASHHQAHYADATAAVIEHWHVAPPKRVLAAMRRAGQCAGI